MFTLIAVTSCEKDDDLSTIDNTTFKQKMTGSRTSLSQIKRENHDLFNFISDRALSIAKSSNSSNGTILDTTHIQVLEGVDFKNYIFKVTQDSTTRSNELKNYMLVILKDSIQHQYMVTYPYVNSVIDTTNVLIEPVYGTDILNQVNLKCGGGSYQSVWIPGGYVDNRCQSGEHNVDDGPGNGGADGCKYYGGKGSASRLYYEGYFTTQYVEQQPCETIDPGNPGNGGGGPVGDVPPPPDDNSDDDDDNNIDEEPDITVGVTPNDGLEIIDDPNCNDVAALINNAKFKSKIDSLEGFRSLRTETGFLVNKGINNNYQYQFKNSTSSGGSTLSMGILPNTAGSMHVHFNNYDENVTHPITGQTVIKETKTIKMFSPKDLDWLLDAVANSQSGNATAAQNANAAREVFNVMVSNRGNYMIKFEGPISQLLSIPANFNFRDPDLKERYTKAINKNREAGFLRFIRDEFQINDVSLYYFKDNGDVFRIELDENGKKDKNKCHDEV
ncbi:hypothetical protein JCM19298_2828 [Nonlabens ulvanivorans]|nr:hypothetical protein JCM19298_2828 [Nonlabens ulvanivorans]